MPSNPQAKLQTIQRISRLLRLLSKALLALIVLGFLATAIGLLARRGASIGYFDLWFHPLALTLRARLLLTALSALTSAVMFKGIWHLDHLLGNYSTGAIFTRESVAQFRQLGITCLLWGAMNLLWAAAWLRLSPAAPASFQLHTDAFTIGIIALIIAWFMEMAVQLREENELTI